MCPSDVLPHREIQKHLLHGGMVGWWEVEGVTQGCNDTENKNLKENSF